jgi:hypothetical protein
MVKDQPLAEQLDDIKKRLLSDDELKYLRERMELDARASWAWKQIRTWLPWLATCLSVIGSAIWWIVNNITIKVHS